MNLREWLFYTRHQRDPGTIFLQLQIARALRHERQGNSRVRRCPCRGEPITLEPVPASYWSIAWLDRVSDRIVRR